MIFHENISHLILYQLIKFFLSDCLLLEILGNLYIACFRIYDVTNFETKPELSYKAVFLHHHKSQDKNAIILTTKRALKIK